LFVLGFRGFFVLPGVRMNLKFKKFLLDLEFVFKF